MEFDWTQGALAEGLRRYNTGEYFTAHEAWETVWLEAHEPDKTFLQGLIQGGRRVLSPSTKQSTGNRTVVACGAVPLGGLSSLFRRYFRHGAL
jgi:hypothetical protein